MRGVFLCSVAVILVHCTFASASLYNLRANVEAAVSRASTPYRSSIPAPASSLSVPLEEMWLHARKTDERRGAASLDCQAKMLQYEFSLRLQPFRAPLLDVFDSLGLSADCGIPRPVGPPDTVFVQPLSAEEVCFA